MESRDEMLWNESFFQDNFNVDQSLQKYTLKSDLESLRNDLKNYAHELHQQMAEILKTETEAIVNLAEYLTNLHSKIDYLSLPISQLREEIKALYDLIKHSGESYCHSLKTIQTNKTNRNYLNLKLGIIASALFVGNMITAHEEDLFDDSIILERAVNKFSFEYNYLEESKLATDIPEISFLRKRLTDMVNKIFLKSVNNNNEDIILRCLHMYDNLGQPTEAEQTYQVHVVRPALKVLFTENYLVESCNQDVSKIYNEALDFIDAKMATLLSVLQKSSELKSFDFILNSFWREVDMLLREGLLHVTAPGNPELFQKRYNTTWEFLEKLSVKFGDVNLIKTSMSFQEHLRRFNLPVYFEIRFQQIAGQFENYAFIKPGSQIYADANEIECSLTITLALWKALLETFSTDVFIDNLADQFLKLSMLLVARYLRWFEIALEEYDSFPEGSDIWEDFIINSINDLNLIKNLIGDNSKDLNKSAYGIMPTNIQPVLVKVFQVNANSITFVSSKLQSHLTTTKSNESFAHLQQVAAIPRLYRRTNRNAPKEASNYMVGAINPILKFHEKFKTKMKDELQIILDAVISNNTQQYLALVEEVLRSVCKTEESLRRLKNRNILVNETATEDVEGSDTMSDEMKIREQIKLDVFYFIDKLYPLALEKARKSLHELKNQTC